MGWPEFSFHGDKGGRGEGSRGRHNDRGGRGEGSRGRHDDRGGRGEGSRGRQDDRGGRGEGSRGRQDDRGGRGEGSRGRDDDRGGRGEGSRGRDDRGGRGEGSRGRDDDRGGRGGFRGRDDDRGGRGEGSRGRDDDRGGRGEGSRGRDDDRGSRGGFRGRDDDKGSRGGFRGRDDDRGSRGGFRGRDDDRGSRGGFRGRDDDRSSRDGNCRGRDGDKGSRDGRFRGRGGFRSDCPRFKNGDKGSFRGSRGLSRGGRGGGKGRGPKGGKKTIIEPHRHEGVFISRGKQDELLTINLVPGDKVYKEKHIVVYEGTNKIEYRTWNPFRSKLAAAIIGGIGEIHMKRGSHVLYLGAASGTTVSHVSDIVGADGMVYAVEFSVRSGRDLLDLAQRRMNIVPIIEDARHPTKYRMLVGAVDVIFSDVAQPDQARILALNAENYLNYYGHFIMSIKASCIDSTVSTEVVVSTEIEKLRKAKLKPIESLTLEPYERNHAVVVGVYLGPFSE